MSQAVLDSLCSILRASAGDVRAAYRVGSRVYGTAKPTSDDDFVVIMTRPGQKQDLAFAHGINIVIHGPVTFQTALDDQSVFALECFFASPEATLMAPRPPFKYTLDRRKLSVSATEKSKADWQKAKKRFVDEPGPSRKKVFHALRVPAFALQIAKTGKLADFTCANAWHADIQRGPNDDFSWYEDRFGTVREEMCTELVQLAGKK
ncbi:MAG: nucleotidyltransferase domain-containing protein [Polyangiaceae bacterium]|nr:nucleotidyltransferase domain-containing protein [Polyangiaceae bacterium]